MNIKSMLALGIATAFGWATASVAAPQAAKGQVEFVRTHDATAYPEWTPPLFWFSLKGVTSPPLGTCGVHLGRVLFVGRDKAALSMVLTAQAAGHEIAVYVEDGAPPVNGWCAMSYLTIGNPVTIQ